jgi:hypothetical protein
MALGAGARAAFGGGAGAFFGGVLALALAFGCGAAARAGRRGFVRDGMILGTSSG